METAHDYLMDLLGDMGWTYAYMTKFRSGDSSGEDYYTYYLTPLSITQDSASVDEMLDALVSMFGERNYIYRLDDTFRMFGGVGAPKIEITLPKRFRKYPNY